MTLRWPCPPGSVGLWCPKSTCQGLDACLPGNAWLAACVPGECRRYISQALSPAPPTLCLRLALAAAEPKHLVQQALVGELRGAHGEFGRGGGSDRGKERSDRHQEVRQGQPKAGPMVRARRSLLRACSACCAGTAGDWLALSTSNQLHACTCAHIIALPGRPAANACMHTPACTIAVRKQARTQTHTRVHMGVAAGV